MSQVSISRSLSNEHPQLVAAIGELLNESVFPRARDSWKIIIEPKPGDIKAIYWKSSSTVAIWMDVCDLKNQWDILEDVVDESTEIYGQKQTWFIVVGADQEGLGVKWREAHQSLVQLMATTDICVLWADNNEIASIQVMTIWDTQEIEGEDYETEHEEDA
ncbi:hypothetical protein V5O48_017710 [Marasmius crinis-equi]|uniref:Uncharacterized protein n=1 Tax=Marasmius crinis-equi TaxID=585013 RepID=A0ABR3EN89_9AGAR